MNLEVRTRYVLLDYAMPRFGEQDLAHVLALDLGLHDDYFGSDPTDAGTFLPQSLVSNPQATQYGTCLLRSTAAAVAKAYTMTGEATQVYDFSGEANCPSSVPDHSTGLNRIGSITLSP